MPSHCVLRSGKHRVVETDGSLVLNEAGTAVDGGGHDTRAECEAQSRAVNTSKNEADEADGDDEVWRPGDNSELTRFAQQGDVTIDRKAGIISGVSILTIGEAKGHGQYVDETMCDQAVELGRAKEPLGLKGRFDHPNPCSGSMGKYLGRYHDFRRDGDRTRADFHISDVAAKAPGGNLRDYTLDLAEEDPDAFATSIVFRQDKPFKPDPKTDARAAEFEESDPYFLPHARIAALHGCDVVDTGAANDGIFGRPDYMAEQLERWAEENEGLVARVLARHFNNKNEKEGRKMADKTLQETQAELEAMAARAEKAETALSEESVKLAAAIAGVDEAKTASFAEGVTAGIDRIKARLEKYSGQAALVVETATDDDATFTGKIVDALQTELAAKNKPGGSGDGADPLEFEGDDSGGEGATFESKVAELVEGGMTKTKAMSEVSGEFPKLHEDYNARMTAARKGK